MDTKVIKKEFLKARDKFRFLSLIKSETPTLKDLRGLNKLFNTDLKLFKTLFNKFLNGECLTCKSYSKLLKGKTG